VGGRRTRLSQKAKAAHLLIQRNDFSDMSKRKVNLAKKKWLGSTYAALQARLRAADAVTRANAVGHNIAQDGKREGDAAVQAPVLRCESQGNAKPRKAASPAIGLVPPTAWRRSVGTQSNNAK
jgi:hypothetical protein